MIPFARTFAARAHRAWTDIAGSALGFVAPGAAVRFYASRGALYSLNKRTYESGNMGGPNGRWTPLNTSEDTELRRYSDRTRARVRDMVRNDGRISGALETIVNNVVRTGIWPQAQFTNRSGGPAKALRQKAEDLWRSWGRRAVHGSGESVYRMQRLALRHLVMDGEVLVRALWNPAYPILPLRFELIEADQLSPYFEGALENGNTVRRGVELTPSGEVAAYWILPHHPGDYGFFLVNPFGKPERVPATDCMLLYDRRRVSQTRGISWLASSAVRAFNLSEYDDYEMIGAKLAAAFGVFIKSGFPEGMDAFANVAKDQSGAPQAPGEYIDPGMIKRLAAGESIEIAEHNRPGNNYRDFVAVNQQAVAAGMGLSYESFSKDYSRATYSSARQAILEERTGYRVIQDFLCERMMDWIWERFLLAAQITGKLSLPGFESEPERYVDAVTWQTPGYSWIDPVKDSQASRIRIDLGISSRTREAREQGADFEEMIAEQTRELEQLLPVARLNAELQKLQAPQKPVPDGGQSGQGDDPGGQGQQQSKEAKHGQENE